VRKQLLTIIDRKLLAVLLCGCERLSLEAANYFVNSAKKDPQEGNKTVVEGQPVYIRR
jgi:ATP-dependent RNA helicase DHX8/PRP22